MFGTDNANGQNGDAGFGQPPVQPPPQTISPQPPAATNPISDPSASFIETPLPQPSLATSTPKDVTQSTPGANDNLLQLKQQALQSLAPMVNKLDQTPEEKFKTLMMLIQASDNTDLVKEAYETATQISDEKERAQALIDVVNEINYFTQHHNKENPDS